MPTLDQEIDSLYAGPLGRFTAARNALARGAGARAAEVRALRKPSAPAWAVNQLYWKHRNAYERLVRTAEALRTTHAARLAGGTAALADAERDRQQAIDAATALARSFLREAGAAETPATIDAVAQTLDALPAPDFRGRLVRPLEPVGFAVFASLLTAAPGPARRPAEVVSIARARRNRDRSGERTRESAATARRREADARRREAARRREVASLRRDLAAAKIAERKADTALRRAERTLADAEQTRERLRGELDAASVRAATLREGVDEARTRADGAVRARTAIEMRLKTVEL